MTKLNLSSQVDYIKAKHPKLKLKKILKVLQKNENDQEKALAFLDDKNRKVRKEKKYKEKYPNDTDFDWNKYKEARKVEKIKKKEEKVQEAFPK